MLLVVKATRLPLSPLARTAFRDEVLFSHVTDPSLSNSPHHESSSSPMCIYCLKRFRSFLHDGSPNRRASPTHDGIVKSSISYGANLDDVTFPSRRDLGSCSSGIGYRKSSVSSPSLGCSAPSRCVKYSNLNFGFLVLSRRRPFGR